MVHHSWRHPFPALSTNVNTLVIASAFEVPERTKRQRLIICGGENVDDQLTSLFLFVCLFAFSDCTLLSTVVWSLYSSQSCGALCRAHPCTALPSR